MNHRVISYLSLSLEYTNNGHNFVELIKTLGGTHLAVDMGGFLQRKKMAEDVPAGYGAQWNS